MKKFLYGKDVEIGAILAESDIPAYRSIKEGKKLGLLMFFICGYLIFLFLAVCLMSVKITNSNSKHFYSTSNHNVAIYIAE